jgi:hypothetical protein
MAFDQPPNLAFLMRDGLSTRLRIALMDSFKFSLIAGEGITVLIFIASLYKSAPSEVAPFFSATQPLEKLLQGFSSIDVSVHAIAPASNPGNASARCLSSQVDALLVDLLTKTIDADSGREGPADVADFMRIVCNDAVSETLLRNELGLIIKKPSA